MEGSSQFIPVTDEVVQLVYERNKPKNQDQAMNIDPAWFVSDSPKPLEENFICAICHSVVVDP